MLNRKTPDTLATKITIEAPGDKFTVPIIYFNRSDDERQAKAEELKAIVESAAANDPQNPPDPEFVNRNLFVYVVKSIDGEEPTEEFVKELEKKYPGITYGVFVNFHETRAVKVVKN